MEIHGIGQFIDDDISVLVSFKWPDLYCDFGCINKDITRISGRSIDYSMECIPVYLCPKHFALFRLLVNTPIRKLRERK